MLDSTQPSDITQSMRLYIEMLCFEKAYAELAPFDKDAVDTLKKESPAFEKAMTKCEGIRTIFRQQAEICNTLKKLDDQLPETIPLNQTAATITRHASTMLQTLFGTIFSSREAILHHAFKDFDFPAPAQLG